MNLTNLSETVIKNDYCIGCGACAVASNNYKIELDVYGKYQAKQINQTINDGLLAENVCPFSNSSLSESELSDEIFENEENTSNELLGSYDKMFFGYSKKLRQTGASGGMTTWFLLAALESDLVDAVIHMKEAYDDNGETIFQYGISRTKAEVIRSATTKYYPGELSQSVQNVIKNGDLRYAIVGVPCFIKSLRLLERSNPILKSRIVLHIGLVCGHYKSANYAKMLALQKGIASSKIKDFNFRYKSGLGRAGDYNTRIEYVDKWNTVNVHNETVKNFYGTDWGLGMFKYNACDYCDDVVAETADVVLGDAWVAPYVNDPMGTNIIISRKKKLTQLLENSFVNGDDLFLQPADEKEIIKTQAAGFRHRREGLQLRLYWKQKKSEWFPTKRLSPNPMRNLSFRYKLIYKARIKISALSHLYFKDALDNDNFFQFKNNMHPIVSYYKYVLYGPNRLKIYLLKKKKQILG